MTDEELVAIEARACLHGNADARVLCAEVRRLKADLEDADRFNNLAYGEVKKAAVQAERERCLGVVADVRHDWCPSRLGVAEVVCDEIRRIIEEGK